MGKGRLKPGAVFVWVAFALVIMTAGTLAGPASVRAQSREEIERRIQEKNAEIQRLETEAESHRATIGQIEREANTLAERIQSLDRTIKGLDVSIRTTNVKIDRANLEIIELGRGIRETESSIDLQRSRLGHLIGLVAAADQETPLEILIKHETLASFFNAVDSLFGIQRELQTALRELRQARGELQDRKAATEGKRLELAALAEDLADQKALELEERRTRANLLAETKNQERRYQELLAEVERKRGALQQEINALEAELTADFDRSLLPAPGSGILGWPLAAASRESCWSGKIFERIANCVTQFFGQTAFARAGGYNGQGHNGVDFRAALGTPVFAAERGTVRAVGDTDVACRRASYGRWVLIDHPSNLATLSAHFSLIKVQPGQAVNRGELVGYSGQSGYATGPHLHFSVFARQAVRVGELKSRVCGRLMTLPLSPFGGYLNPLNYL